MTSTDLYTRTDDERLLEILDAKFNSDLAHADVLRKFNISNGALQGLVHRTVKDKTPCKCRKKANRDGGMPARWWAS
jgi:hypothetical protein